MCLNYSELEGFADDKMNATQSLQKNLGRVENIVGKGGKAGFWHFLTLFLKGSLYRIIKI